MSGPRGELDGPDAVIARLKERGAQAAIVAQSGQIDVSALLAAGWRWSGGTDYIAGKRIRMLIAPDQPQEENGNG